jgi:SAM-dependent methyltransferase
LTALRILIHRFIGRVLGHPVIAFRPLQTWPAASSDGWSGAAATARYEAGANGSTAFESIEAGAGLLRSPAVMDLLNGLEQIPLTEARVLDFGCSNGLYSAALSANAHTSKWWYTGVDINPNLIDASRRRFPHGRFEVADGGQPLPFEDGAFDVVIANGVLLAIAEPATLLREFRRVCGPGGWVLVGREPVRRVSPTRVYLQQIWHQWGRESHPLRISNYADLMSQFTAAGFELVWSADGAERYTLPGEEEPVQHMLFLLRPLE